MSLTDNLRALVSVQGIPQKSSQASLQQTFERALEAPPRAKKDARTIAQQDAGTVVQQAGNRQTVFVTSASLATFPVASGVIMVVWKLLQTVVPDAPVLQSPLVPLILAFLIGVFLLYMDLTDPERTQPLTSRDKVVKSVIALINSLFLAAAVLGVDTVILQ